MANKIIDSPLMKGAKAHLVTRPSWFEYKGNSIRVMPSYYECRGTGERFYGYGTW